MEPKDSSYVKEVLDTKIRQLTNAISHLHEYDDKENIEFLNNKVRALNLAITMINGAQDNNPLD